MWKIVLHESIGAAAAVGIGLILQQSSIVSFELCRGEDSCVRLVVEEKKDDSKDQLQDNGDSLVGAIDQSAVSTEPTEFGTDESPWSNDGECDDPRFEGIGMAVVLVNEDRFRDATDCEELWNRGAIRLASAPGPRALAAGDSTSAEGSYIDRYRLVVPTGPALDYQIDLRSKSLDTVLRLFASDSDEPIAWNDDYRNDTGHSHISINLSPGEYTLEVSSFHAEEEGTYGLNVKRLTDVAFTEV